MPSMVSQREREMKHKQRRRHQDELGSESSGHWDANRPYQLESNDRSTREKWNHGVAIHGWKLVVGARNQIEMAREV